MGLWLRPVCQRTCGRPDLELAEPALAASVKLTEALLETAPDDTRLLLQVVRAWLAIHTPSSRCESRWRVAVIQSKEKHPHTSVHSACINVACSTVCGS